MGNITHREGLQFRNDFVLDDIHGNGKLNARGRCRKEPASTPRRLLHAWGSLTEIRFAFHRGIRQPMSQTLCAVAAFINALKLRKISIEPAMIANSRRFVMLVSCGLLVSVGCSRTNEEQLTNISKATDDISKATDDAIPITPTPKNSMGVRVFRDDEADQFCKWIGVEADCYRFGGGWIECWLDIEAGGETKKVEVEASTLQYAANNNILNVALTGELSGQFLWIRHFNEKESWSLPFRYSVKNASGTQSGSCGSMIEFAPEALEKTKRLVRGDSEVVLEDDVVVTLVTLIYEDGNGNVTRTAKLQCKKLK